MIYGLLMFWSVCLLAVTFEWRWKQVHFANDPLSDYDSLRGLLQITVFILLAPVAIATLPWSDGRNR